MANLLIVEDSDALRDASMEFLSSVGHKVDAVSSAEEALSLVEENTYDLIFADLQLPKKSGIQFVEEARTLSPHVPIIMMSAFGTIDYAVQAIRLGAQDFISKPFSPDDLNQIVLTTLNKSEERKNFQGRGHALVTENPRMREVLALAQKLAPLATSVLITGESGSGKELLARYIHEHGNLKSAPFVGVNCASIPKNLMESEFFGYEAGSFTGAHTARAGLFEEANKGTLFLDEIGEMPPSLQVKLLRAIQDREIRRLGSAKSTPVDVRIISATNRNLEEEISKGNFREDLYFRIGVFTLEIPSLRERRDDIPLLVQHFSKIISEEQGIPLPSFNKEVMSALCSYDWPGNVREVENVIERALVLSEGEISVEHLALGASGSFDIFEGAPAHTLAEIGQIAQQNAESVAILACLSENNGNKTKAAQSLGVSYKTLLTKIKQYKLEENSSKSN